MLAGPVVIHTEFYEPVTLATGDSLYIDSSMAHAYTAVAGEAQILVVTTGPREYA